MIDRSFIIICATFFVFTFSKSIFFKFNLYAIQLGIAQEWAGLIIAADSIAFIGFQPLVSHFLGRLSIRLLMVSSLIIGSIAMVPYYWATEGWFLFALRFINGIAYALFITSMMSALVQCIPEGRSGRAFLWMSLMPALSYALIPALVELFALPFPSASLIIGILILAITPLLKGLSPSMTLKISSDYSTSYRVNIGRLMRSPAIVMVLGTLAIFSSYSAIFFYLEGFAKGVGITKPSIFFSLSTVSMIIIRIAAASYIDRLNKLQTAFFALLMLSLCHAAIAHIKGDAMLWVNGILSGIGWGLAMPLMNALIYELSESTQRAFNLNMAMIALQLSFFAGPFTGGLIIAEIGYGAVFYASAIVVGILALSLCAKDLKATHR